MEVIDEFVISHYTTHRKRGSISHPVEGGGERFPFHGRARDVSAHGKASDVVLRRRPSPREPPESQSEPVCIFNPRPDVVVVRAVARSRPGVSVRNQVLS
ncbi:uncharacterized protein METZ01_LOCUS21212 [marine metagenome]|uniref:Uncharacterized protein n=1 Tax=marine metagenome TaxID=408172 RepID=A0A381PPG3_9ZZZZ